MRERSTNRDGACRTRVAWLCSATLVATTGCRVLFGLEEDAGATSDAGDGGSPTRWWIDQVGSCEIPRPPTDSNRPTARNSESVAPIFFALSHLRVGAVEDVDYTPKTDAWSEIGFDLDGRCTRAAGDCSSVGNPPACVLSGQEVKTDGYGCRDNAIGRLIVSAQFVSPDITEAAFNCEIRSGGYNIVLRLSEYNGKADDPSVRVDIYTSVGVLDTCDGPTNPLCFCDSDGALCTRRRFDCMGNDDFLAHRSWWDVSPLDHQWVVMPESVAPMDSPCAGSESESALPNAKVCDANAFVRGWFLAATFDAGDSGEGAEFWLNGQRTGSPGFRTILTRAHLVGKVARNDENLWVIDEATLGGTATVAQFSRGFAELGFCEATCPDRAIRDQLQAERDIVLSAQGGDDVECDALSIGYELRAHQTGGAEVHPSAAQCAQTWPSNCGTSLPGSCSVPGKAPIPPCSDTP